MNGRLLIALGGHNKAVLGSGGPRLAALKADLVACDIQLETHRWTTFMGQNHLKTLN